MALHSAVYDGLDSIYVVGGFNGNYQNRVLKYSLRLGSVDVVGIFVTIGLGIALLNSDEILYLGGRGDEYKPSAAIYRYSTDTNNFSQVGKLPWAVLSTAFA